MSVNQVFKSFRREQWSDQQKTWSRPKNLILVIIGIYTCHISEYSFHDHCLFRTEGLLVKSILFTFLISAHLGEQLVSDSYSVHQWDLWLASINPHIVTSCTTNDCRSEQWWPIQNLESAQAQLHHQGEFLYMYNYTLWKSHYMTAIMIYVVRFFIIPLVLKELLFFAPIKSVKKAYFKFFNVFA